jgi:hypothetical protein
MQPPNVSFCSTGDGAPGGRAGERRRSTALMRATSSRGLKGFDRVVGTELEADDAIDIVAFGGEHHDADVAPAAAQTAADRQAILTGQHQIHYDDIDVVAGERLIQSPCVGDRQRLEALLREIARQQIAQSQIVIDDEDPGFGFDHHPC